MSDATCDMLDVFDVVRMALVAEEHLASSGYRMEIDETEREFCVRASGTGSMIRKFRSIDAVWGFAEGLVAGRQRQQPTKPTHLQAEVPS